VQDIIERVAALAAAHPENAELDCNRVIAGPDGAVIVDARTRLAPSPARPPVGALNR
jgi:acetate---CoA ligase (ADP-forming)